MAEVPTGLASSVPEGLYFVARNLFAGGRKRR